MKRLLSDLTEAILDGATIDWSAAESRAGDARRLVRHFEIIATVADVHARC